MISRFSSVTLELEPLLFIKSSIYKSQLRSHKNSFDNDEIAVAISYADSLVVDQTIPDYLAQEEEPLEDTVISRSSQPRGSYIRKSLPGE